MDLIYTTPKGVGSEVPLNEVYYFCQIVYVRLSGLSAAPVLVVSALRRRRISCCEKLISRMRWFEGFVFVTFLDALNRRHRQESRDTFPIAKEEDSLACQK
jgi:hypothetical protein